MDVCVVLGSKSDLPIAEKCRAVLEKFEVSHEIRVASAHRAPKYSGGNNRRSRITRLQSLCRNGWCGCSSSRSDSINDNKARDWSTRWG